MTAEPTPARPCCTDAGGERTQHAVIRGSGSRQSNERSSVARTVAALAPPPRQREVNHGRATHDPGPARAVALSQSSLRAVDEATGNQTTLSRRYPAGPTTRSGPRTTRTTRTTQRPPVTRDRTHTSERCRWLEAVRAREAARARTRALRQELAAARAADKRARHAHRLRTATAARSTEGRTTA